MGFLCCSNLTKAFKGKTVLRDVTFSLEENRIIGLIGKNGAGKTTLLRECAGRIRPDSGSVKLNGDNIFDNINALSEITFSEDDIKYEPGMSLDEILFISSLYYKNWDKDYAGSLMKTFGLDGKLKYRRLSKGFRKVFNNIAALSTRSAVTIMDEPLQGMDFEVRKKFFDILLNDFMEYPRLFFISSHIISEMQNLLEEVLLLDEGRLVCHMAVEEMQQYAVFINGKKDIVHKFIETKKVLCVNDFGNSTAAGIVNDLSEDELRFLTAGGADISKMGLDEVCINLLKINSERLVNADE